MSRSLLLTVIFIFVVGCTNPFADPKELYEKGLLLYSDSDKNFDPKNVEKAKVLFSKAANRGYGDAEYMLGRMYARGDGFSKDLAKALDYYKRASAHGSGMGSCWAAMAYREGRGVEKNEALSLSYIQKGVDQGSIQAKALLGHMYFNGDGVPQSYRTAHDYLTEPASKGDEHSLMLLAAVYALDDSGLKDEQKFVLTLTTLGNLNQRYFQLLAAAYNGYVYAKELPNLKSSAKAIEIYNAHLDEESGWASFGLASCYLTGNGVQKDITKGREFLKKASSKGYSAASQTLCYSSADLLQAQTQLDDVERWCLKPAENENNSRSQLTLVQLYLQKKEFQSALEWAIIAGLNDVSEATVVGQAAIAHLTPIQIDETIKRARDHWQRILKAAEINKKDDLFSTTSLL